MTLTIATNIATLGSLIPVQSSAAIASTSPVESEYPCNNAEFTYWQDLVRAHGYDSLESYLMLTEGYEASTRIPPHMRKHSIQFSNKLHLNEKRKRRRAEIRAQLAEAGINEPDLSTMSRKVFHAEVLHPDLMGFLQVDDFESTVPDIIDMAPEKTRARQLMSRVAANGHDLFPGLHISPAMPVHTTIPLLYGFLVNYREAERLFRDGGKNHFHCRDSSTLVANMLLRKGFEAFSVWAGRIPVEIGSPKLSQLIGRLADTIDPHPADIARILEKFEAGMSYDRLLEFADFLSMGLSKLYSSFELLKSLSEAQRVRMIAILNISIMHSVTAVQIGGTYYLIDIDAQQFGDAADRVIMVKEDKATLGGIMLFEPLSKKHANQSFLETLKPWETIHEKQQTIVREYMKLMGTLPNGS